VGALACLLGGSLAALALAAAPATAATPRFLGTGHDPGVAVDRAGTAHVAWLAENGAVATLEYCQVPRHGHACAARQTFPLERAGTGKVQVVTHRGAVFVLAPVGNADSVLLASPDGGATFTPHPVGKLPAVESMLYGPRDSLSVLSGSGPASYGLFGLDGSGPGGLPVSFGDAVESLQTSLASTGSGLVAFRSGSGGIRSDLFNGPGDPNAQASWVEGPALRGLRSAPAAAGGRSGTFLAYVDRSGSRSDIRIRRLAGARLTGERRLSRDDPTELSLAQSPAGALSLIWPSGGDAWIVRSRHGRRWTAPHRLFRGSAGGDLRSALGSRGGWAVWDGSPGNTGSFPIRLVALPRAPRR
jgi:hypothetical protein